MDLSFSPEQIQFRKEVREWIAQAMRSSSSLGNEGTILRSGTNRFASLRCKMRRRLAQPNGNKPVTAAYKVDATE